MFYINQPSAFEKPWVLSSFYDDKVVSIDKNVTKELINYQLMGINFLYQNYKAKLQGAILNEDDGMNIILQVCSFLNSISKNHNGNLLILVVCQDDLIKYWKYHLSLHAKLNIVEVNSESNFNDFNGKTLALVLGFSNLNLVDDLVENDYFSVIFDDFDLIANKRNVKKLTSNFNIGLTKRNFIVNKDQKLKWTMLNWSNPGCVGKLVEFYDIDKNNLEKLRDNYRHWWFRLTWNYCESFKKLTVDELKEYDDKVNNWVKLGGNKIIESPKVKKVVNSKYEPLEVKEYSKPLTEKKKKINKSSKECFDKPLNDDLNIVSKESVLEKLKKSPKKSSFIDCTNKTYFSPKRQRKLKREKSEEDLDKCFEKEPLTEIVPLEDFYKHSYKNNSKKQKTEIDKPTCSKQEDVSKSSIFLTQTKIEENIPRKDNVEENQSQKCVSPIESQSITDDEIAKLLRETQELLADL